VSCVKSFSVMLGEACACFLLTRVLGTVSISCIMLHTNVDLNSWCDSFESLEGRAIKLLRMVQFQKVEK
jgi:hypothetical protein